MIQVDGGRQQEAGEYVVEIACERLPRQDENERPREAAHRRVRRIVERRAYRRAATVPEPEIAENRTSTDRAGQRYLQPNTTAHAHRARFPSAPT